MVRKYPSLGDAKAVAMLAANGFLTSVLIVFSRPLGNLILGRSHVQAVLVLMLLAPLVALVLLGAGNALRALTLPAPVLPGNLASPPEIAALPFSEYRRRMSTAGYHEALREMMRFNHAASCFAARRFRLVERSVVCLRAAFGLWLLLMLRLAFGG
jgi:hypothetical protein